MKYLKVGYKSKSINVGKYSYKFWSRVLTPIDKIFNIFGFYIEFVYEENQKDLFNKFNGFKITHYSKLDNTFK